jgi:hypothetical protein
MAAEPTAIAIAQEGNKLRAVCLRKHNGTFELLWTKSCDLTELTWPLFAEECGLSSHPTKQVRTNDDRMVMAGFGSEAVVFYRIDVPAVRQEEMAAMVELQAEARLPLTLEQMELAWQTGPARDGQVSVTIAAARKQPLHNFVENVRRFKPDKILLDCEPIVEAWRNFFTTGDKFRLAEVVVSIAAKNTRLCLVENGRLSNAVSLDVGTEDFSKAQQPAEQTEVVERFVQDTAGALELFGCSVPTELPIFVLSDGGSVIQTIVSSLGTAGLTARAALPKIQRINRNAKSLYPGDIYEYRVPLGLASMALEKRTEQFNIFERLYSPAEDKEKKHWMYSPRAACVIVLTMLFLFIAVLYADDVVGSRRLGRLRAQPDCQLLIQRQKLIKTVAQQRPDVLQLLNEINTDADKGILLDSFDFKKGQPVTIKGQTSSTEQMYKFQENLLKRKGIEQVKLQSGPKDSKTNKFKFTMTFHYKNLTKKRT